MIGKERNMRLPISKRKGVLVRKLRKGLGLKLREVHDKTGIPIGELSAIENAKIPIGPLRAMKLAQLFGARIGEFYELKTPKGEK
jgi:transcriptional regulator with XRE-family HTH domain